MHRGEGARICSSKGAGKASWEITTDSIGRGLTKQRGQSAKTQTKAQVGTVKLKPHSNQSPSF